MTLSEMLASTRRRTILLFLVWLTVSAWVFAAIHSGNTQALLGFIAGPPRAFWFLLAWLTAGWLLWMFKETVNPVVRAIMTALALQAQSNVLLFVIAICLAASACGNAFADNFMNLDPKQWADLGWWQILALSFKSATPAFSTIAALLIQLPGVKSLVATTVIATIPAKTSTESAP